MAEETLKGILHLHYETGYEGSPWAFQDEKYITFGSLYYCKICHSKWDKSKYPTIEELEKFLNEEFSKEEEIRSIKPPLCLLRRLLVCPRDKHDWELLSSESWSYDGLNILNLGDHLKVYDLSGNILFDGVLLFGGVSDSIAPFWYPKGITRSKWTRLFDRPEGKMLRAELIPSAPARVLRAVHQVIVGDPFVQIESFEDWTKKSGIALDMFTYVVTVARHFSSRKNPSRFQLYFAPRRSRCGCTYKKPDDKSHVCVCHCLPEDILSSIKPL